MNAVRPRIPELSEAVRWSNRGDYDSVSMQIAEHLFNEVIPKHPEGFTFSVSQWCCPSFPPGYFIVSYRGFEKRFFEEPSVFELEEWVSVVLPHILEPKNYIGFWWSDQDKKYCLDVSTHIKGINAAISFGIANEQQSIFDPMVGESIPLPNKSCNTDETLCSKLAG